MDTLFYRPGIREISVIEKHATVKKTCATFARASLLLRDTSGRCIAGHVDGTVGNRRGLLSRKLPVSIFNEIQSPTTKTNIDSPIVKLT